ncbi:MAG: phage tail tape measure protein [Rhodopirellula sp.]|nr:phage tail tape measure protein [Rhodopirellula sp.]
MPAPGAIRAGRAFVELFADDSRLVRGLKRAERKLRAFGDSIRNFGLKLAGAVSAITAPLGAFTIKAAADAQESLSRFEQVFKDQADAAGEFADALAKSVGRSRFAIRDALATFQSFFVGLGFDAGMSRELSQTLQKLALDFASFNNISDDEAIQRFISALSGSSEVLDRFGINIKQAALEQELLRLGIRKSWSDVTEQEKALARLNIITRAMGDQGAVGDAVRTAGSFTNQMKRLRGQVRDAAVEIGQALLPAVTPLVKKAAEAAKWFGQWIKQNQQLVATIFKVAAGIIGAGVAIAALGIGISGLGSVLGAFATVVAGVAAAFKLLGAVLVFLVSPIGLVITAVVGLGVTILHVTGAGAKALGWLGEKFSVLKDDAISSYQGIADALAAGDIALAANILWLTLKMEWTRGINFLEKAWLNFRNFFIQIGVDAWHGLLAAVEVVWHSLQVGWIETTAFLSKTWTQFTSWVQEAWAWTGNQLAKAWNSLRKVFDSSFDADAANRAAEAFYQSRKAQIEMETGQAIADREAQRQRDREKSARHHEATMAEIGRENLEKHRQLDEEYQRRMAENEADLARARKEWQEALEKARRKRAAAEGEDPEEIEGPEDLLSKVRSSLSGLGDLLETARERTINVIGTFNASSLLGLQAGSADDRIASATERTAKGIDGLRLDVRNNRAVFS